MDNAIMPLAYLFISVKLVLCCWEDLKYGITGETTRSIFEIFLGILGIFLSVHLLLKAIM
ncbi:hypothetical protein [Fusobacterium necrophorum]|uniref:hypothetical protein n=1 Tax=Fusobacterium necrophorum TaxID=859 RepID=UPI000788EFF8|nr:hypothetical protein [Fusobacterium necrophorum]KYM50931.1 hypothetical protein A2U04_00900 [Fusobacterium necrophorum subsp. funduliforme]KYM65482.1 hypothetical protein A2U16_03010 [Fusobacterium necrophorum subsp. funduliforme]